MLLVDDHHRQRQLYGFETLLDDHDEQTECPIELLLGLFQRRFRHEAKSLVQCEHQNGAHLDEVRLIEILHHARAKERQVRVDLRWARFEMNHGDELQEQRKKVTLVQRWLDACAGHVLATLEELLQIGDGQRKRHLDGNASHVVVRGDQLILSWTEW